MLSLLCCSLRSVLQLVLPQHLRALPVYINSLRKSDVLLSGLRTSVHQRLQQRCQVLGMDTLCTSTHFYPLLLPLVCTAKTCVSWHKWRKLCLLRLGRCLCLSLADAVCQPSQTRGAAALLRQQPEARWAVLGSRATNAAALGRRSSPSMHPGPAV